MNAALKLLFEEQIRFRLEDGTDVDGSVFIGDTEFLPVEILQEDQDAYREEFNRWLDSVWKPEQAERRNSILSNHGNRERYMDLLDAVRRQQVVPLVGSGMSVPSQLPTWSDLLRRMMSYSNISSEDLEKLIANSQFEEAADLIASGSNRRLFDERVDHNLRPPSPDSIDGPVRLLPAIFPRLILTTNLDDVLERVFQKSNLAFDHVLAGTDVASFRQRKDPRRRFLLKLHGDCRNSATRVLLTSEYEAVYADGSAIREELALLLRSNSVLFLGCSLGPDRTVRLINDVADRDHHMPRHYAFLPLPDMADLPLERENFLTMRGIYPIWYNGPHDEAISALLAGLPGGDGNDPIVGDEM